MFSIYDTITKDAPDVSVSDEDCIKLGVQRPKPKAAPKETANHSTSRELIAAVQTQTKEYFSIFESIGLS